ncbi:MAG: NfeD family protein [Cyanobacterium sp. T60_A2020_053]|nr:NfeD family protein [Cyanobacterium sp. T60_A2020_053]
MSPVFLWLIVGAIFCFMELVFPSAFVELMMGLGALIVAILALIIPYHNILIVLWMVISFLLILLAKKYFTPKRQNSLLLEEDEAVTITTVEAGKTGRVLYEGTSWMAKCADENIDIEPEEKVYIVSRNGNTLLVLPQKLL